MKTKMTLVKKFLSIGEQVNTNTKMTFTAKVLFIFGVIIGITLVVLYAYAWLR